MPAAGHNGSGDPPRPDRPEPGSGTARAAATSGTQPENSPVAATRTSKALAAWQKLNDRQQATLREIYALDQAAAAEETRRDDHVRSRHGTTAPPQRRIDFALIKTGRRREYISRQAYSTNLQNRLSAAGYDNQGNGSTMAALAARGLIEEGERSSLPGRMRTVTLTRAGRAAVRAGTARPGAALSARSWEVLALLWEADTRGDALRWKRSTTIDKVLIGRHQPPLAERARVQDKNGRSQSGFRITDHGRRFYREHYAGCAAAYPGVRAPRPDRPPAFSWPQEADDILTRHYSLYRALCLQWEAACKARDAAGKEAAARPPGVPGCLPADIAAQAAARHELWRETARQRAALAASHAEDARARARQAAHGYAVAALAAYRAAVTGGNPLDALQPPGDLSGRGEQQLAPPAETGIHAIDAEAMKLHAAAAGGPVKQRDPPPPRRRRNDRNRPPAPPGSPGSQAAALAHFLHEHVAGGNLTRRLHRPAPPVPPASAG